MYEVQWGEDYRILEGGNCYEPCMTMVREKAIDGETIPSDNFIVRALHAEDPQDREIEVTQIIALLHLAADYEDEVKKEETDVYS